ncbi:MAG: transglutaminase domain-containing protein [Planctomycetota bacterium]
MPVALCRSLDIPAREVAGWGPPPGQGHVWAQVRLDGVLPILYLSMPQIRARLAK